MADQTPKSYQTTKLTHEIIKEATKAVTDYETKVKSYYEQLTKDIGDLLKADVFSGDAADGFKSFYDNNVVPTLTDSLKAVNQGIKDILSGVETTLLDKYDPGLKEFNSNPGAGAGNTNN